jgi:2'-5' RNA ligase
MESSANARCAPGDGTGDSQGINSFALVTYIPGPLARFLDDLRRELVHDCAPRAHVTILPPRPLKVGVHVARDFIQRYLRDQPAFAIETAEVEVFRTTSVVYIGLAAGRLELERMHEALNDGPLQSDEPHTYHPHITLAQGLEHAEQVAAAVATATRRWAEYRGPRRFDAETITFVQNTIGNLWLDLAEFRLGPVPVG